MLAAARLAPAYAAGSHRIAHRGCELRIAFGRLHERSGGDRVVAAPQAEDLARRRCARSATFL